MLAGKELIVIIYYFNQIIASLLSMETSLKTIFLNLTDPKLFEQ